MNKIDHAVVAPLVRGLCLQQAARPVALAIGAPSPGGIPAEAFAVDLSPALRDGILDEGNAAKVLTEACAAWIFERSPAGIDAVHADKNSRSYPSCLALTVEKEPALYWIDTNPDAARNRAAAGDARLNRTAPARADNPGRADVVRRRPGLWRRNRARVGRRRCHGLRGGP